MKASLLIVAALSLPMAANASLFDNISSKLAQKPAASQPSTTEASSDLVSSVMSQLNLNQNQAEGGLGSLLTMAQSSLSSSDFSQISSAIPNASSLLAAAPSVDNKSGLSGLLSKAGNVGSSLQGSAMVYDAFEKLGISKEMIAPMVDILKNYLQSQGGTGTASLLTQGLGALL
ncbi:DUF2780 domain-containing protein [Shewanella sp. C32]|uniref:DUF2780 domain-containing protein n=1 Tax=Shewanella electrica TaxID=515560 RepID=A0ABT2FND9_9GAMM|nr:DUF2780 domain-containing protein [Shewanella electrica]MCH1926264.1 DUF2780 domain-containing protein [Shewanella electrica]MCS4557768.1 DUF2780 domain-containing protein [Shewanella electrica]